MKRYLILTRSFTFLTILTFFTSCNGQVKKEIQEDKESEQKRIICLKLKIPKLVGINKEANIGFGIHDKSGNIWFGSNGEGVFCFNGKYFVQYTMNEGLNSNITYSIVEDKAGSIWVGTNKGLNRFNGKMFENISIDLKYNKSSYSYYYNKANPPSENKVWSMMADRKGVIWFGTDDGVYCFNGKEFTRFLDNQNVVNKDSLKLKAIFSILETDDGNIWFTACQSEGVSQLKGNTLLNIIPYKNVGRTDKVIEDKKGNLWFACVFKGVGRFDGKTFTQNVFNEKAVNGPSNIVEDTNGKIWFDTQDGLGCYDGKILTILTVNDGIPNKNIIPVLLDNNGKLWFSCKGMGLYQYYDGKFINYSDL